MAMPFILVCPGVLCVRRVRQGPARQRASSGTRSCRHGAPSSLFSRSASLARIILRVSTGGAWSSFLLARLGRSFFSTSGSCSFRRFLPDPENARWRAARLVSVGPICKCDPRPRRHSLHPLSPKTLLSSRGRRAALGLRLPTWAIGFEQALNLIALRTAPDDFVSVMPEGTSLNFLSGRRNPLHDEIVTPGFLGRRRVKNTLSNALRDSPYRADSYRQSSNVLNSLRPRLASTTIVS